MVQSPITGVYHVSEACSQKEERMEFKSQKAAHPLTLAGVSISVTSLVKTLLIRVSPGHSFLQYESSVRIFNRDVIVKKLKAIDKLF